MNETGGPGPAAVVAEAIKRFNAGDDEGFAAAFAPDDREPPRHAMTPVAPPQQHGGRRALAEIAGAEVEAACDHGMSWTILSPCMPRCPPECRRRP